MLYKKVSCVICAFNERERIGDVLKVVSVHPDIAEVVVVDDGSTDGTSGIIRMFPRVRLITLPVNRGKSHALAQGVKAMSGDMLLTLDADLKNLRAENISALIRPVLDATVGMSVSLRGNSFRFYRLLGLDFVSGERVFPRALLLEHLAEIELLSPFGIELLINREVIARGMRIAVVDLPTLAHVTKMDKRGFWRGLVAEGGMLLDILRTVSLAEIVRQNYRLLRLRTRVG